MEEAVRAFENKLRKQNGKLFNFRPVLFFALFFAWGVFCGYLRRRGFSVVLPVLSAVLCAPLCLIASGKRPFSIVLCALLLLCFGGGTSAFNAQYARFSQTVLQGNYTVSGRVKDQNDAIVILENLTVDGKREYGRMQLTLLQPVRFSVGDEIVFDTWVTSTVKPTKTLFSYGAVTDRLCFYATGADNIGVVNRKADVFSFLRERIRTVLYTGMEEESAAIAYAIFTGNTSGIERQTLTGFRYGGIAHIFAVSGLHIGALYAFCRLLTDKTRCKKLPAACKFFSVAAVLVFYGGICGFSASVVRAVAMCLCLYASGMIGVKSDTLERVGLAMLVVLLISPAQLLEVGFLLSFAACFGICVLARPIGDGLKRLFVKGTKGAGVCEFFGVTLGAQLFTLPLLASSFGYLSVWGVFLNCIFVPLLSAVFSPLLAATFLCCLLPNAWIATVLSLPSLLFSLLSFFFYVAELAVWRVPFVSVLSGCAYYAALCLASDKIHAAKGLKITLVLLFICAYAALL